MLVNRLFELSQKAYNYNMPVFTEFLDLNELKIAENSGIHKEPVFVIYSSYFKDDERRIIGFFPNDYIEMTANALQTMLPITVFKVKPSFESSITFTHRDLLGTLLGLGLERRLIGDILVYKDRAYIQCLDRVSDIINDELRQVKHQNIYLETVGMNEVKALSPNAKELVMTVASERLDVIVKGLTNQSRNNASAIVQRGDVKVNQVEMSKIHASIEVGDVISIRRYGKFKVTQIQATKKSGRLRLTFLKYI